MTGTPGDHSMPWRSALLVADTARLSRGYAVRSIDAMGSSPPRYGSRLRFGANLPAGAWWLVSQRG